MHQAAQAVRWQVLMTLPDHTSICFIVDGVQTHLNGRDVVLVGMKAGFKLDVTLLTPNLTSLLQGDDVVIYTLLKGGHNRGQLGGMIRQVLEVQNVGESITPNAISLQLFALAIQQAAITSSSRITLPRLSSSRSLRTSIPATSSTTRITNAFCRPGEPRGCTVMLWTHVLGHLTRIQT
eukprot:TRINITY_DN10285_c0_g1_i1.p3 TRINITY_DN10285_c0_g1~~TRINITY_DN10285_c0_g1_i1.p3  ORF type:complete len:179 (+),score=10.27 TRINITY_DN10285_c0_g1_i1:927-1463(+)